MPFTPFKTILAGNIPLILSLQLSEVVSSIESYMEVPNGSSFREPLAVARPLLIDLITVMTSRRQHNYEVPHYAAVPTQSFLAFVSWVQIPFFVRR